MIDDWTLMGLQSKIDTLKELEVVEGRLRLATCLLIRVLEDENFGIGLSEDIRNFLAAAKSSDEH